MKYRVLQDRLDSVLTCYINHSMVYAKSIATYNSTKQAMQEVCLQYSQSSNITVISSQRDGVPYNMPGATTRHTTNQLSTDTQSCHATRKVRAIAYIMQIRTYARQHRFAAVIDNKTVQSQGPGRPTSCTTLWLTPLQCFTLHVQMTPISPTPLHMYTNPRFKNPATCVCCNFECFTEHGTIVGGDTCRQLHCTAAYAASDQCALTPGDCTISAIIQFVI